ncbi:hypothetical protein R5R35_004484 [Gryllus longicercus]|uniref:Protein YIPF n=1 Tax=Gryllus longicercus TaxID=2509291 RepID=A0AAN9VNW9_9ORTH
MACGDGRHVRSAYEDLGASQTGNITIPNAPTSQEERLDTLDEPIFDTFWRDVKAVGIKFFHVLYPKNKEILLKDWDLWGPLLLCTFMALILRGSSDNIMENDGGPELAQVFLIVWIGSIFVTLNSKLLGGNTSFFQNVCVLGYCLLPTTLALIICRVILIYSQNTILFLLRLLVTINGFIVASYGASTILGNGHPSERKALVLYPIFLFYFVISWLVISHTS